MAKLRDAEYLHVGKRRSNCISCGASLQENEKHPSILVQQEEALEWDGAEKVLSEDIEEQLAPRQGEEQPSAEAAQKDKAGESPARKSDADDEAEFIRLDYCESCWNQQKEQAFFSFWIGRREESGQPRKKLNRTERNLALQALFDSLSERQDDEQDFTPHLYFLAHLLMKYKIFKWIPSIEDEKTQQTMLRFIRVDNAEEVRVPETEMPPEMIVQVRDEIQEYLLQSTGQEIQL